MVTVYTIQIYEPPHDKINKMTLRPAKTQISLGIRLVWSEFSLSAWRKRGSLAIHWAHSEDCDQTGWMPRLVWVFTGRTATLLVLSWSSSIIIVSMDILNCFVYVDNKQKQNTCFFSGIVQLCLHLVKKHAWHCCKQFNFEVLAKILRISPAVKRMDQTFHCNHDSLRRRHVILPLNCLSCLFSWSKVIHFQCWLQLLSPMSF